MSHWRLLYDLVHNYYFAGVKIYWYPAPILLHAKHISVDDDIAVIGSSNPDIRSFQLNLEVTLVCYDTRVVAEMRRIEEGYLHKSRQVLLLLRTESCFSPFS